MSAEGGKRFIYDVETDGFLERLTTIHSLVMWDLDTQQLLSFRNDGNPDNLKRMEEGVRLLNEAEFRAGHNIIKFDEMALQKVYPWFIPNKHGVTFDTLVAARLVFPSLIDGDKGRVARNVMPGRMMGLHSLEAWGYRLGMWKGEYSKLREDALKAKHEQAGLEPPTPEEISDYVWGSWNQDMQDYCDQDVRVNAKLFGRINSFKYPYRAFWDEMDLAYLTNRIEINGFPFKVKEAGELYAELVGERARLSSDLITTFGSWVEPIGGPKTPSTSNSAHGYWGEASWVFTAGDREGEPLGPEDLTPKGMPTAFAKTQGVRRQFTGYPYQPIKIVTFNPTSRFHIAARLKVLHGWEPSEFTKDGEPKVDEEVLEGMTFPEAPLLIDYFTVSKRIGQLAEGKQAWLKHEKDGNIHGRYNTVGAVTRRATHSSPNIGQVPGVRKGADKKVLVGKAGGWGLECRQLFGAPEGWYQVGTDASGLELRCLAHYMSAWDGGAYAQLLLTGDVHTENQKAAGLPTRDAAKTFIYAFLYGAGDAKIGSIVGGDSARGKLLRSTFMQGLPALGNLVTAVKTKAKNLKKLTALDGGILSIRSDHSALNTLLQSAGALICKKWGVFLENELLRRGYKHGWDGDFAFMAWVHDEYQIAARTEELAHEIGEVSKWAIKEAERYFNFQCPLDIDYKVGKNWADCH